MKTYQEWLKQAHPEALEEGWGRNILAAGLMGMGALGSAGCTGPSCPAPQQQSAQGMQFSLEGSYKQGTATNYVYRATGMSYKDAHEMGLETVKDDLLQKTANFKMSGNEIISKTTKGTISGLSANVEKSPDGSWTVTVSHDPTAARNVSRMNGNGNGIESGSVTSDDAGDFLQKSRSDF